MKKLLFTLHFLLFLSLTLSATAARQQETIVLPYRNPQLPIEHRVQDLLQRMTLEEKAGQLCCIMAWNCYEMMDDRLETKDGQVKSSHVSDSSQSSPHTSLISPLSSHVSPSASFKQAVQKGHVGNLWATFRADPWTQKTLQNGLNPVLAAEVANALQRYVRDSTRLGIPLLLAEEAPHGHMAIGATVLPTGLAMTATWSPEMMEQAGRLISSEVRWQGAHVSYGPVLDLARDPRWSRVEETLGEDPVLAGQMGAAMVRGLGGGDLTQPLATVPTLKHFIAYGASQGGQNGGPTQAGPRELHEYFLPPFRDAIEAGALSVMTAYNSVDGIPCTADSLLLTDLLRRQWNFRGFVVSDLYAIDGLAGTHRVAANRTAAAAMALQAGVDVDLGAAAFSHLPDAVANGLVSLAVVDSAVARVLRLKFQMGLFDQPFVKPEMALRVRCDEHRQTALQMARAAVTLLKNEGNILPLQASERVLLCGPNADNRYNLLGDYTAPQADASVQTILDGLRTKLPAEQLRYVKGCAIRDTTQSQLAEVVQAAAWADVIVCCVGGSSARDFRTSYAQTGAAETAPQLLSDMDCGEGFDRATLALLGHQQRLLQALRAVGKPLVVVYVEGRPMDKAWAAAEADALLTAYYPGEAGGKAVADVLMGDYNPAGRLPISVPRHVGQLPVYYNQRAPQPHDYVELSATPLFPFGFGLSYTTFRYSNLQVQTLPSAEEVTGDVLQTDTTALFRITFDVTNTGRRDGDEVAQLYIHDDLASTVRPLWQLRAFRRLFIPAGETRFVTFTLTSRDLAVLDRHLRPRLEPGTFTLRIGPSSATAALEVKCQLLFR